MLKNVIITSRESGGNVDYKYDFFKEGFEEWARNLNASEPYGSDLLRQYLIECGYKVLKIEEDTNIKAVIWEAQNRDPEATGTQYHIASPDDITRLADFTNCRCYRFPGIKTEKELLKAIPNLKEIDDTNELEDIFDNAGIEYEYLADAETKTDVICYSYDEKTVFNLTDCSFTPVYEYWDGGNHKQIWLDDANPPQEIVYSDDYIDLDKFDGSNFYFRTRFNHGRIHRLIERFGEPTENEFVLYEYTQYQEDIPVITFIDEAEKEKLFEESRD